MEFKSFLEPSNSEEEKVKLVSTKVNSKISVTRFNLLDDYDIRCINCNQNIKPTNITSTWVSMYEDRYFLCENCRKASFKVKIFR